jgi:hypothetical protein
MIPFLSAFLLTGSNGDSNTSGLIVGFIALALLVIIVLSRLVLGGKDERDSGSLSLSSSDSTTMATTTPEPKQDFANLMQESIHGWGADSHDAADEEFEATIAETIPVHAQEKAFYVKVRGTSHRNSDRTSRTRIIGECSPFESIALLPQPDDPEFPNAIRVCRVNTHEQLGFLESRLAEEISRDMEKNGPRWAAFFRRKTQHPESGRTVGAVIRLIRLSEQFIAESDTVRLSQLK